MKVATKKEIKTRAAQNARVVHNNVVAMQAAWIEWQRGRGAEAAMQWIHNTLWGPGLLPGEGEPNADDAQAWFDANQVDIFDGSSGETI